MQGAGEMDTPPVDRTNRTSRDSHKKDPMKTYAAFVDVTLK